ncbi:MAG: 16S rRNA (cytidine(1402)-2'-O)-methyltransferase [Candidatus Parcubacteria bacterium]|nr:16S rRNA (cytidine(1402)-2'-O)-methyltransferase [Burkholderiales bacterium]
MAVLTAPPPGRLTVPGTLYVVATPIGNLADSSPRSVEILSSVRIVACEDTRTSRTLLAHHGISARTVALHSHNEREAGEKLLRALREGDDVALVSDAGTPAVSDPGALLVAAAHREGLRVIPVPGPSAAIAAYSAAGFAADRFVFAGFLPAQGAKARAALLDGLDLPWPVILYEAPHRVLETVNALLSHFGPRRELVIARELTKKFEEVARMALEAAPAWLAAGPHRQSGEFVLVLGPGDARRPELAEGERILSILLDKLPASEAARLAARITGLPRKELYAAAVKRSNEGKRTT